MGGESEGEKDIRNKVHNSNSSLVETTRSQFYVTLFGSLTLWVLPLALRPRRWTPRSLALATIELLRSPQFSLLSIVSVCPNQLSTVAANKVEDHRDSCLIDWRSYS